MGSVLSYRKEAPEIFDPDLMPELPEVETFRRFADQYALHRTVRKVNVFTPKILENMTETQLSSGWKPVV